MNMTEYLKIESQKEGSVSVDQYFKTTEFALKVLIELVREDIIPLSNEENFSMIVAFCLTHVTRKPAFNILNVYAEVLRTLFDAEIPCSLRNVCALLDRASSIPYDTLKLVPQCSESPLRALQNRTVLLSSLLDDFNTIITYFPANQEGLLAIQFLLWGKSCGHLEIYGVTLDLYVLSFKDTGLTIVGHVFESIYFVIRCWISRQ
jgi:hypothetical protein